MTSGKSSSRYLDAARDPFALLAQVRLYDNPAYAVPCPRCGTSAGERCRTARGSPAAQPHQSRYHLANEARAEWLCFLAERLNS